VRVVFPNSLVSYIKTHLRNGLQDHQSFGGSLNILLAAPDYARDPEIRELLVQVLATRNLGWRCGAAKILHAIGDPLGILHLTYNTVKMHPILGQDHTKISGWGESTAAFPLALTDQCLDLLVEDMRGERPIFHGGTLAKVPAEKIVPRVLPLLSEGGYTARFAAYILAASQHEAAVDVLFDWLQPENFKKREFRRTCRGFPALWAVRLFPHERLLPLVRNYIDPTFQPTPNEFFSFVHDYRYFAQYISDLAEIDESVRVPWMMNKYHKGIITQLGSPSGGVLWAEGVITLVEPVSCYSGAWDSDLLINATQEERTLLAAEQEKNLLRLLHGNHLGYDELLDGKNCAFIWPWALNRAGVELYPGYSEPYGHSGFHIIYDEEDYVRAATDWILHSENYLVDIVARS
jgi:hypothetical protein